MTTTGKWLIGTGVFVAGVASGIAVAGFVLRLWGVL